MTQAQSQQNRASNAAWDAFYLLRRIVLEETKSETLQRIANRRYRATDYTKASPHVGLEGETVRGATVWFDNTVPPQIVNDMRKALPRAEITQQQRDEIATLIRWYTRLRDARRTDHHFIMADLKSWARSKYGNGANLVNF
jgi:hypothetical protein